MREVGKTKSDIVREALKLYFKIMSELKTRKIRGLIKGVKLEDVEEAANELKIGVKEILKKKEK